MYNNESIKYFNLNSSNNLDYKISTSVNKLLAVIANSSIQNIEDSTLDLFDYSSICMFLAIVKDNCVFDWDEIVYDYMLKIKKALDKNYEYIPTSLYRGKCEVGFSLYLIHQKDNYYTNILNSLNNIILKEINVFLSNLNQDLKMQDYDIISGLSGVCSYLLLFKNDSNILKCIHNILKYLISITNSKIVNNVQIPGWYISSNNQFLDKEKKLYPNGNFNFGFSHGISGILAILSISMLEGIEIFGQKSAIKNLLNTFSNLKYTGDCSEIHWRGRISLEDFLMKDNKNQKYPIERLSWCYGTPGIARSLFLGGKAIHCTESMTLAINSLKHICNMDIEKTYLNSPIICHGYAGLLAIMYSMYIDTNEKMFKNCMEKYSQEILKNFDNKSKYGFYNNELIDGKIVSFNNIDFLEGSIGINLALLLNNYLFSDIWLRYLCIK